MATWSSNLYLSQLGTAGQSLNVGTRLSRDVAGKLREYPAHYVVNGNEAANEYLNLVILKPGERVIPHLSWVTSNIAANTVMTLAIGDANDSARYANGLSLSNTTFNNNWASKPGTDLFTPVTTASSYVTVNAPVPASLGGTGDQQLVRVKFLTASSLSAGQNIRFDIITVSE